MKCPLDQNDLVMSERQGIEIDYCPACRGVWLDRGELDKLIERGREDAARPQPAMPPQETRYRDDDARHGYGQKKRKQEGFLGDLFDF